jgi:hypothetical protein
MSVPEHILELLRKLLVFEEGANKIGSINEAEVAAVKIQEILLKYNLDREKISAEKRKYVMKDLKVADYSGGTEGKWIRMLLVGLTTYNFCELIITITGVRNYDKYRILGTEENTETVIYLFEQLRVKIIELSKESWKGYQGIEKHNTYLRGFLMGAAMAIRNRLHNEWEKAQKTSESTTALILSNKSDLMEFRNSIFTNVKTTGYSSTSSIDGHYAGVKAGKTINIHKGITEK